MTRCARMSIDTGDSSSNSTNLALKAIFGIQAMAEISQLLGKESDLNVRRAIQCRII